MVSPFPIVTITARVSSATYDAANELTNWNSTAISYDANGNMLTDGSNAFTWNARNQVATLNNVSLQYDAFGRRITNAAGTSFLYDGANAAQELSGATVTANLLSGGIDEIFSRSDSVGALTQLKDALGSTIALVDSSGNAQTSYTYDPFGNTSVTGASNTNEFQYTGRENDGNGLYYYRTRYYSPLLGRFISEDPLGITQGVNFYAYVHNSPTNLTDPSGMGKGQIMLPKQKSSRGDTFDWWGEFWYQAFLAPGPRYHPCPGTGGDLICNDRGRPVGQAGINDSSGIIFAGVGLAAGAAGAAGGAAETAGGTLVPMADAAFMYGNVTEIAGYEIGGTAGMVGETYSMNIWALYATDGAEGLGALTNTIVTQAEEAGASQISITGNAVVNQTL